MAKVQLRASASRLRAPRFISGTWNAKSSGKLLKLSEVKEHLHARNLTIHHRPYMGAVRRPVARTRGGSPFGLSHNPRIPDRVVFEKLVQVLVFGCAYERIADESCSATTLRRRRDEWIVSGAMEQLQNG